MLPGVPHASIDEDAYRGMRIPAGTTVITNLWSVKSIAQQLLNGSIDLNPRQMMRDPKYFPNPSAFNPERFREKVNKLDGNNLQVLNGVDNDDPSAIAFGFGRRCTHHLRYLHLMLIFN